MYPDFQVYLQWGVEFSAYADKVLEEQEILNRIEAKNREITALNFSVDTASAINSIAGADLSTVFDQCAQTVDRRLKIFENIEQSDEKQCGEYQSRYAGFDKKINDEFESVYNEMGTE